jgi:sodium/hydrogen exchanger 8
MEYKKFDSKSNKFFQRLDENYLKPFLIYNYEERKEDIKLAKRKMREKEKHVLH